METWCSQSSTPLCKGCKDQSSTFDSLSKLNQVDSSRFVWYIEKKQTASKPLKTMVEVFCLHYPI